LPSRLPSGGLRPYGAGIGGLVTPAEQDQVSQRAQRLGIQPGMTVQELGFDEDVDGGISTMSSTWC